VDADGNRLGGSLEETATARLAVDDDGPGFGDALGGSARVLAWLGVALALLAAVLLPFLWIPALVVVLVTWSRRRRARRDGPAAAPAGSPTPPAPPAEPEREREPVS
jgi:hypothetical protein